MAKKTLSELFKRWANRGRRVSGDSSGSRFRTRLRLEEVEQRLAPATLPPVTASDTRTIAGGFAPQVVADPNNPNTLILVDASGSSIQGNISRDGGQTWAAFGIANPDAAGGAGPGGTTLTTANSPSVTMSRDGELYVAWTTTTADFTTAGRLRVASFMVPPVTGVPTVLHPAAPPIPANPSSVIYEWLNQDPVYNPTIAVDNNPDQYSDPQFPQSKTLADSMLGSIGPNGQPMGKAVYVAWNTNATAPTVSAGHAVGGGAFTANVIFTAASSDQGATWSTPVPVDNGGFASGVGGVAPQILYTPADLNPSTSLPNPGKLNFVWNAPGGGGVQVTSSPDGGQAATQVVSTYTTSIANHSIIDASTNPNNAPDSPGVSTSSITILPTDLPLTFSTISDLDVTIAVNHPHVDQLEITLIAPNGVRVNLLSYRTDDAGNTHINPFNGVLYGLPGGVDMGINTAPPANGGIVNVAGQTLSGTVFDSSAARQIYDPANVAPYIDHFRPEADGTGDLMSLLNGGLAATGTWTIEVQDMRNDPRSNPPTPVGSFAWSLHFSSLISATGFGGASSIPMTGLNALGKPTAPLATGANLGGGAASNATALGIGGNLSVAYDKTQGAFSPYSGRFYEAYVAPGPNDNADIFVRYSDDNGATFPNPPVRVNTDSVSDNVTEGNRSQFMPTITVDPVTGTVVVMWYDARNDASNTRVATYMATSIDGGDSFSAQSVDTYLNSSKTAVDQITRTTVDLEPIPTNLRAAGASEAGQRQALLAFGGQIKPFWTGNLNAAGSSIFTATVQTASGPRVFSSDLGAVTEQSVDPTGTFTNGTIPIRDENGNAGDLAPDATHVGEDAFGVDRSTYNDSFAPDGTRLIDGFEVIFDRPIDVSTFTADQITVLYRAPTTLRDSSVPPTKIPIAKAGVGGALFSGIIPIDPTSAQQGENATAFFIQFATPQSSVGTYSYSIGPNDNPTLNAAATISDRIRSQKVGTFTPPDTPTTVPTETTVDSTLSVPPISVAGNSNPIVTTTSSGSPALRISASISSALLNSGDLVVSLYGPDPDGTGPNSAPFVTNLTDEIQLVTLNAGFVNFKLTVTTPFGTQATASLPSATTTAGSLQTAIANLSNVGLGNVLVTNDPSGTGFDVEFVNQLGFTNLPLMTSTAGATVSSLQDGTDLSAFVGVPMAGAWTLRLDNSQGATAGTLNGWSLTFLDTNGNPLVVQQNGNYQDQDTDSRSREVGTDPNPLLFSGTDLKVSAAFANVVTSATHPFSATDVNSTIQVTSGTGWILGSYTIESVTAGAATLSDPPANNVGTTGGSFNLISTAPQLDTDAYTAPTTVGADPFNVVPFALTFDPNTLPLIEPGPHLVSTSVEGSDPANSAPSSSFSTTTNLVLNGSTSGIDLTFDRDIDPASFTPANILRMTGPAGVVNEQQDITVKGSAGTFTVSFTTASGTQTTDVLPFNIPAVGGTTSTSSLQNALAALANIGTGNVTVTSTNVSGGIDYRVTFGGTLGTANQPTLVAVGTGGTTATVATERFTVTPLGSPSSTGSGGYRSFRIGFPTQQLSGSYNIEFGPNQALPPSNLLYSIRSAPIPQLVYLVTTANNVTIPVTFAQPIPGGLTNADIVSILGPGVPLTATQIADAQIVTVSSTSYKIVFSAADFPTGLPKGQYVVNFDTTNSPLFVINSGSAIDENFNAGLDVLRGTDPSNATFTSSSYSSTGSANIAPAVDDGTGTGTLTPTVTRLSINITDDFIISSDTIQNIQLLMNISHPNDRDLDIDLISPSGTDVRLFSGELLGGTDANQTANFTNTRFLDRVGDPNVPSIENARPPFNAGAGKFYTPQTPLSVLIGEPAKGLWTLQVTNNGANPYPPTGKVQDPNFNPTIPIAIQNWTLTLPHSVPGTGLGESVADRFQASFRIFTQDPTNAQTQQTWTAVGPAPTNETANSARITAIAVDPSDPTGNTAYVAAAGAGIWKTTNFLTTDPNGPQYTPLTDFGSTNAVNVSSIALFPRNNDPLQTIIFAVTGESNTQSTFTSAMTSVGVGVIRSMDGGRTWSVLDSMNNVASDGSIAKITDPVRKHEFVGSTGYKIVVDPHVGTDGGVIVYMALSGGTNPGVWRSLNGGNTWSLVQAGNATDVILAAGSANTTNPITNATVFNGNLQQLYAAFSSPTSRGPAGVYFTDSAPSAASLAPLTANAGRPLLRDISIPVTPSPQITVAPSATPNGVNGRIALAVPALTGDPVQDSYLKDWLYALTATGLYVTKDAGQNWTKVQMPQVNGLPLFNGFGTNDETKTDTDLFDTGGQAQAAFDIAITVDPQNPNIVYLAGAGQTSVRMDLTDLRDTQNWTFFNDSDPGINPGNATTAGIQANTVGGVAPQTPERGHVVKGGLNSTYSTDFLNLVRDYNQPFVTNSPIRVTNTGNFPATNAAGQLVNDGADAQMTPFSDLLSTTNLGGSTSDTDQNRLDATNIHQIVTITDPVTGKTRLVFATDNGVFTGVDSGDHSGTGTLSTGIGFSGVVNFNRNGNLQISQFFNGAVQPSQFAADLAGALLYASGDNSGFPVSSPDILSTGNLNWRGPTGTGVSVLTDATGNGIAYQYRSPANYGQDENTTATEFDFFRVLSPGSDQAFGGGFSRTGGVSGSLINGNEDPGQPGSQWPYHANATQIDYLQPTVQTTAQPAVNPLNPLALLMGSTAGRVYRSIDQGKTWVIQAVTADIGGSIANALAFGASDPTQPTLTNNFLYVGTAAGNIYSTTTGGVPWTQIGSAANGLDGSKIISIVPDPKVGTKDLFAITTSGVYYKADGTTAAGNWVNITGNLFQLTHALFGNAADQTPALVAASLSALAVDWRFAFPDSRDPNGFPTLYVAGNGGVFRYLDSTENTSNTWTFFPDVADDGAPVDGGYLPDTHITDLDLSIGDIDPATGKYKEGGLNMLVATTYGRGQFAIRLTSAVPVGNFISGPIVTQLLNPNPVNGPSDELDVRFGDPNDPNAITPVDPTTFSPADVQLLAPNGTPITVTSVDLISVPDANGVNPRNLYAIHFAPQATLGTYSITIGYNPLGNGVPEISDPGGNLMNQNDNSSNGEPNGVDQYTNQILLNSSTNEHLVVTSSPVTLTAGSFGTVKIEAHQADDSLDTSINGPLTFTAVAPTGNFTTNPTVVNMVNGVATFTVEYDTSGPQTVSATFGGAINGTSWTTNVVASVATHLSIGLTGTNPPISDVSATAGDTKSFTITARDQFENFVGTYSQTANLTTGVGSVPATLPSTVDLVNGTGTFTGTFNVSGSVQIVGTSPDPTTPGGTLTGTANVTIAPGAATHLGSTIPGTSFNIGDTVQVQVQALDAQGNIAKSYNGPLLNLALNSNTMILSNPTPPTQPAFVSGVATFSVTFTSAGTNFTITATSAPLPSLPIGPFTISAAPPPPSPTQKLTGIFALGTGVDGSPTVGVYNSDGSVKTSFIPFPPQFNAQIDPNSGGFTGGLRVAVGDVTGDGIPDYVVGSGPGITAAVVIYSGATNKEILRYFPYEDFTGGVFVAVGDITKDGIMDIAITPDEGGGPRVEVLRGGDFTRIANFFGIDDPNFRGGARPAIGDLNGDGYAELVVSAGFGGGPRISIFDGAALAQGRNAHPVGDFYLFDQSLRNGAYVSIGDVDGDGFGDIIGGAGPGGGPRVLVISGKKLLQQGPIVAVNAPIANFFGGDPDNRGGIRVAAKNIDGDRNADILVGPGDGGGSVATMYKGSNIAAGNFTPDYQVDADPFYSGGVFVG